MRSLCAEVLFGDALSHCFYWFLCANTKVHLLTDVALGGDLFSRIEAYPHGMPEAHAAFYTANVACALMALHDLRIVHRDLKPENVLLDGDGYAKLIAYGVSKLVDSHTYTVCGTPAFMAPEIISQRGHNTAADWCAPKLPCGASNAALLPWALQCCSRPKHSR